jgi:hypothetical protein
LDEPIEESKAAPVVAPASAAQEESTDPPAEEPEEDPAASLGPRRVAQRAGDTTAGAAGAAALDRYFKALAAPPGPDVEQALRAHVSQLRDAVLEVTGDGELLDPLASARG